MAKIPDQTKRRLSKSRKQKIIDRDESTCGSCGVVTDAPEVDHWVPLSLGGTEDDENLGNYIKSGSRICVILDPAE